MVAMSLVGRKLFKHRHDSDFEAAIPDRGQKKDELTEVTDGVSGSQVELHQTENGNKPPNYNSVPEKTPGTAATNAGYYL